MNMLVREQAKLTRKERAKTLTDLLSVGALMANVCHNLSQQDRVPKPEREIMDRLRRRWDATLADYGTNGGKP